jgi:glycosyltransferase involved in cell wall biosynthesis
VDEAIKSKVLERIKKDNVTNVELLGFKNSYELKELIFQSRFVVVPSLWYENQPYSILESFASGKAVVASRIGGIPEIVHNGKDGFLFEPGDVNQFVQKIKKLLGSPALAKKLGQNAKKFVDEESSPKLHYERIMTIYNSLIA